MSYFDDNEDRIIFGGRRTGRRTAQVREKIARAALAAPPGSELAKARIAAHAAFDPFWKSGMFSRGVAYEWLASEMGLPIDKCHMVLFNVEQCRQVVAICEAHPTHKQVVYTAAANDFEDLDK
jgi:hypothetical protein